MAESIDELQIKVEAEAENASNSLDELIGQLNRLNTAVGKIQTSKLNSLATALNNIGNIKLTDSSKEIQNLNKDIDSLTSKASKSLANDLIKSFNIADSKTKTTIRSMSDSLMQLEKDMDINGFSNEKWDQLLKQISDLQDVTAAGALGEVTDSVKRFHDEWMQLNRDANGNPIYVNELIRGDFSDQWKEMTTKEGDFIGKFTTDMSKAKMGIDDFYQELEGRYPELFPQDLTTGSDEFKKLIDVVREYNKELQDTSSITQGLMTVPEAAKMDITKGVSNYDKSFAQQIGTSGDMNQISETYQNIISQLQAQSTEEQKGFSETVQGIQDIANAVKNIPTDDRIEKLKDSLSDLAVAVSNLSGISDIADGMSKLNVAISTMPEGKHFNSFVGSIDALNKADVSNIGNIADRIDRLADSMAKFSENRSYNVNVKISEVTEETGTATNEDIQSTENLAEAQRDLSAAEIETAQSSDTLAKATEGINEAQESGLSSTNDALSEYDRLASAEDMIASFAERAVVGVSSLRSAFTNIEGAVKTASSAILEIGQAFYKLDFGWFNSAIKTAGKGASTLSKNALDAGKSLVKMVADSTPIAGIGSAFDALGRSSNKLSHELSRLSRMFSNLVARTAMRAVMSELDTSFQHLAQESSNVNEEVSSLMSSLSQLSHSIAAVAEPLLDIFGPALEYIIGLLNTAITYVNQFLAAITGKTYKTGAYVGTDYVSTLSAVATEADDAAESQKKLNKQLQGFNELNNLTTSETSSGSGGSGSGADAGGYEGGYFEDLDVSQDIQDFVDKLLEAWENSDFTEIGNILGEKLKEALESIPWDEIQYYAEKIAHSLATLINGFVETEGLGETIGNTLGEAINTALIFADEFITTLHWDSLGTFVADIVNGAIESVDWDLLGKTLGDAVAAWLEYGFSFVTNVDWAALGEGIGDAVNGFVDIVNDALTSYDWSEIGSSFAKGINAGIATIEWGDVGTLIANGFNTLLADVTGFVDELDFSGIGQGIADAMNGAVSDINWNELGTTITSGVNGIFTSVNTWASSFDFSGLGTSIASSMNSALKNTDWSGIGTTVKNAINGVFSSVSSWGSSFDFSGLGSGIASAINTALKGINWSSIITATSSIASGIATSLNNVITTKTFSNLGSTLGNVVNTVVSSAYSFIGTVDWDGWGQAIGSGISEFFATVSWESIGVTLSDIGTGIMNLISEGIASVEWDEVGASIAEMIRGIKWLEVLSGIADIIVKALLAGLEFTGSFIGALLFGTDEEGNVLNPFQDILDSLSAAWDEFVDAHPVLAEFLTGGEEELETTFSMEFHVSEDSLVCCYDEIKQWFDDYPLTLEAIIDDMFVDIDDRDRVMRCIGEIIELFTGEEAKDYQVEGVMAIIDSIRAKNGGKLELEDVEVAFEAYALVTELQCNLDDKERTIEILGELYKLLVGKNASDATIEGLTGVVEYLVNKGQLTIENVTASVILYGYLEELYDDLTTDERKVEIIAQIEEFLTRSGIKVEGLEGEIESIINNCNDPLDAVAQIYDYLIEKGLLPEVDGVLDATEFKDEMSRSDKTAEDGTLEAENLEDNIPENQKHPEIEPSIAGLSYSKDLSIDATAHITNLTQEQKMELFGEITKVIDGTSGDNYVDSIGNIIKIITGKDATTEQINGLTGVIEDLKNNGNLTVDNVTAAILSFLYPDEVTVDTTGNMTGVNTPSKPFGIDAEGNIVDIDYNNTFGVDVDGNMKDLDVPNSLKNIQGMTGYISQALSSGQLSVSDVRAMVSQAVANGQLSMDDVRALVNAVEAQTGVSLTTGVKANSVDANGNSLATIVKANSIDSNGNHASAPFYVASFNNNGQNANAPFYISNFNNNGQSANAPFYVESFNNNGKNANAPFYVSEFNKNGKNVTAPVMAESISNNGKSATAPINAEKFNNNGKYPTVPFYAQEFNRNGKYPTTPIYAESFNNNGKNATTKVLASSFDNNGKNATTKVLASAFDNNGKNATTKVLASSFDNNGKNATTKVLASSFDNNGKNATAKILASSLSNNGNNVSAPFLANKLDDNNKDFKTTFHATDFSVKGITFRTKFYANGFGLESGKTFSTKFYASGFSTNGNKFTTTFYASSLNKNGNSFKTTFYASSLNRNGNTFSTTFYATSLNRNGHTLSAPFYATSLNKNGCSITLTGTVSTSGSRATIRLAKNGGVFSNGRWSSIPQYADGTANAGSLFVAGEAGPELVGHIGGQTEVLNASQLASVMRDAVVAGIAHIASYLNYISRQMVTNTNGIINAIYICSSTPSIMPTAGGCATAIEDKITQAQEDTDQIIGLLSDIESNTREPAHYEVYSDPDSMFRVMRKKNNEYIRKTGKSAFE